MSNLTSASGEASVSSGNRSAEAGSIYPQQYFAQPIQTQTVKKKRNLPGNPDPDAEVIALSPKTLMATNRFICEICNKGFQRDQNLQLHKRGHNLPWKLKQRTSKEIRKKVYVCPENSCVHHDPSRALGDLTGIKKHFCRKHGEKKWKCDKCSKRYAVQSDWKAHSKTCGTREYRCDCGTLFSRRDSFITHRAFCDALAEESARAITGNPLLFPQAGTSTSHINLQVQPQFNSHDLHAFSIKKEQQNFNLRQEIPPWLACPPVVGAGPGPPPIDLASSSIFSTRSLDQEFTQTRDLNPNPNPNPSLGPTLPPYHPTASPHMSATALLQKAAQMGATMGGQTCSSPAMMRPYQAHVSPDTGNNTTGFGLNLSSREEMASGFVHDLASFENKAAVPSAGLTGSVTVSDAFGGILNSKKDHFHGTLSKTTTNHLSKAEEGGLGGNDGMTRDFLGLRAFSHSDILNIAGLGNCMSTPHDQNQNQTQNSWQAWEWHHRPDGLQWQRSGAPELQSSSSFSLSPPSELSLLFLLSPLTLPHHKKAYVRKFEIADDMFRKDGTPFQIIGGDLHYFRILPEYWEDRLLRAKALGLNTIQTYVPWNLHEPRQGQLVFDGIADIVSFIKLCQKLDFLVMLRPGPYICAEWDFGGFPAWLLAIEPALRLRSSDPAFLDLIEIWWGNLLPKVAPLLYDNGGPIIMVQIENEYGSYGDDKAYLHHLVKLARGHLGDDIILYTTDGGSRETLEKGTIRGDTVFSAVDFSTGDEPWPIFKLQKEFNAPGKSPPLSAEFYTGWLTHWGEDIAKTDAEFTADALEKILSRNGSAVLYMVHGGTNFGFYSGANTGANESDYKPDLTSYDYDAPIKEYGDVDNAKFKAVRRVIEKYSTASLPSVPSNNEKTGYGRIQLQKTAFLFDVVDIKDHSVMIESENPISMESAGQMFGFLLYVSEYTAINSRRILFIPKVHDRAQVFISCPSEFNGGRPRYVGTIERWSNRPLSLPYKKCVSNISLFVLVENMGRVNYGPYTFDRKGILSSVYLDGKLLHGWKMLSLPFHNLNEVQKISPVIRVAYSEFTEIAARKKSKDKSENSSSEPTFYAGRFVVDKTEQIKDTFISFYGWGKGIAFVNEFNIGRFWPSFGPQCNLYVPAPILQHGENVLVILELDTPSPELVVSSVDRPNFSCGASSSKIHQL
ncbi:hypothetical protein F0562_022834 [Nyssa sinensis]|uniref:Beta-galactosidase n=1 Tax=Nyssa sinensis TaxID=561372 RepID=A0A5J5BIV5_9ASTE|nr:hypothetical protein F0562_022834 [Nyssa sinensis]